MLTAWQAGIIANRVRHADSAGINEMLHHPPLGNRPDGRNRHASDELDLVDVVELLARRHGDFDIVTHLLADQRAGER